MFKLTRKDVYYLGIIFFVFYALPVASIFLQNQSLVVLSLLLFMPLTVVCAAVLRGVQTGFSALFVAVVALLFVPSIFIFYNDSATVYIFIYAFAALLGNSGGFITKKYLLK